MKNSKLVKVLLFVSGIIGIGVGSALLFDPVGFEASAEINLAGNVNLLSEMRAPGGALLAAGVLILLGGFIPKLTQTSILLSSLFYLSYGLSRVVSIIIDGVPNESLVVVTVVEIIIGIISLAMLVNRHRAKPVFG